MATDGSSCRSFTRRRPGRRPARAGEEYEHIYRLCHVRGPEGIIVELAEQIG